MKLAIIRERMLCLLFLCETMFTIGELRTISYPNDTEVQAQQVPANSRRGRFSIETPSGERRLKFIGERIEEDNREAENIALAQRRQHSDHKRV